MKGILVFGFLILMAWAFVMCGADCDDTVRVVGATEKSAPKRDYVYNKLHSYFVGEFNTIKIAADRNKCTGDLFLILLAIRKAEGGRKGLEVGVMHPRAKNTNLDTQSGWAAATVVKNYQRWLNAGRQGKFIVFLGNRYCPPDVHRLNRHWVKNVTYWYKIFKSAVR